MVKIDRQITAENDPKRRSGASLPILVVDDSNVQLRILASLVKRMGHKVVMASSGQEALDAYENGIFSIIISDWMMPDMDGLDLCRAIRKRSPDAYIYFILLTSKGEKDDIAQGLDAGADDFLTKPVNGEELRARMTAGQRIIDVQQELRRTLTKLRELYDAVDRDLIEARKLQHSLIREPLQNHGAATLSLFLQSSGRVGGDLVGTYPIDENKFGAYSIDVSGHGVASALLSARLAGYLSSTSPEQNIALSKVGDRYCPLSPSDVVAMLNDLILNEVETEHYFTIALTHIDASTGAVVMCQAGHPHPALQNIDGSVEFVGNGGMPVCVVSI